MKLKIKYANQAAKAIYENREKPLNWKDGDSGIDVSYVDVQGRRCKIPAGGTGMVKTGIMCQLDDTGSDRDSFNRISEYWPGDCWEIQVRGRSGNNSKGILTHIGTVDYGYTGEIGVVLTNLGKDDFIIEPGDRIAQLVVCPILKPEIVFVDGLEKTDRGEKGFGSSGK